MRTARFIQEPEFTKTNKSPIFSIIFVIILMCFYGFATSTFIGEPFNYIMCVLWCLMAIAASLNQGNIYRNTWTRWADILCGSTIFLIYSYLYWTTMTWWHKAGGILAIVTFFYIRIVHVRRLDFTEYVWAVNVWHLWVLIMIFLVPYGLPEGHMF